MDAHEAHPHELISAFLDRELRPAEHEIVERHLGSCADCRRFLEDLRALAAATAAEEPPPVPADLASRITARLPASAGKARPFPSRPGVPLRPWWLAPLPLAAAASILLVGGLWLLDPRMRTSGQRQSEPVVADRTVPEEKPASAPSAAPTVEPAAPPVGTMTARNEARESPESAKQRAKEPPPAPSREPAAAGHAAPKKDRPAGEGAAATLAFAPSPPAAAESVPAPGAARPVAAVADTADGRTPAAAPAGPPARPEGSKHAVVPESEMEGAGMQERATGTRRLVLLAPQHEIELDEAGVLRVRAAGYECTLATAAEAGGTGDLSGPAKRGAPADSLSPAQIFAVASSAVFMSAPAGEESAGSGGRYLVILNDRTGAPIHAAAYDPAAPAAASAPADLAARLLRLVQERYRAALEEKCGALPAALQPPA